MISISVIIPMFNNSNTIIRALESVYCQNFDFDKVVVIDDCSTDDSNNIVMEKINDTKYSNLSLLKTNANVGPGGARNVGLSNVDSEYVAFLDADDIWLCDKTFEQLSILMADKSIDIICSPSVDLDSPTPVKKLNSSYRFISWQTLLFKNYVGTRSVIGRAIFFTSFLDRRYTEDYFMWLHSSYKGAKIALVNNIHCLSGRPEHSSGGYSGQLLRHEIRELRALFLFASIVNIRQVYLVFFSIPFSILKFVVRFVRRF